MNPPPRTIIITTLPKGSFRHQQAITIRKPAAPVPIQVKPEPQVILSPPPTPIKRPASVLMTEEASSAMPRKRERLTHLTAEQKMDRRKLKNRIAAQTARDRKKAKMMTLEESVEEFQSENDALADENAALRARNTALEEENAKLRRELEELKQQQQKSQEVVAVGSAASISAPLPRDQATTTSVMLCCSILLSLLSKPSSRTSSKALRSIQVPAHLSLEETRSLLLSSLKQRNLLRQQQPIPAT